LGNAELPKIVAIGCWSSDPSAAPEAQRERERRDREQHLTETGRLTLGDEITLVENQLEVLAQQLRNLRKRADERR